MLCYGLPQENSEKVKIFVDVCFAVLVIFALVNGEVNTMTAVLQPATPRKKVSFGVSLQADEALAIDERIAQLEARLHVPLTRSNYFALLARHDIAHKTVELILSQVPAVASAA